MQFSAKSLVALSPCGYGTRSDELTHKSTAALYAKLEVRRLDGALQVMHNSWSRNLWMRECSVAHLPECQMYIARKVYTPRRILAMENDRGMNNIKIMIAHETPCTTCSGVSNVRRPSCLQLAWLC